MAHEQRRRDTLDPLIERQQGIVLRDQALAAGMNEAALRWLLERGRWQTVLPSVYASFTGSLSQDQRAMAALLYGGERSLLTGPDALRRHGFRYPPNDTRIHLLVPHGTRRSAREFVVLHRTTRMEAPSAGVKHIRICSAARAVGDTCRHISSLRTVRAVVAESVQRKLVTIPALASELREGPRRGSRLFRTALDEVSDGVRSTAEAELRKLLSSSAALPKIHWNPELRDQRGYRLPTPDAWIDDVGIAVEVDSREFHLSPEGWQRTLERHNELAQHGALVLHVTPQHIRRHARAVRRTVERTCAERASSGARAAITMIVGPGTSS